jgi:hypothetical protein
MLGVCPNNAILLRQTICKHLRRSQPEKILNVFQRIRFRFFRACGLAIYQQISCLATKDYSDRPLGRDSEQGAACATNHSFGGASAKQIEQAGMSFRRHNDQVHIEIRSYC